MIVKAAKVLATRWVREEATTGTPGFGGACYSGSIPWLPADADLPASSDVDILVVADPPPAQKLGKFRYHGLLLDVSYLPAATVHSPERVLGDYHLAGSFSRPNLIHDPAGHLARLQAAVAAGYADPAWVRRRCAHVREVVRGRLGRLDPAAPGSSRSRPLDRGLRSATPAGGRLPHQVAEWVLATGQTTHLLLVAGLRNPTVRRRYAAVRELLAEHDRLDVYEHLLDLLGCAGLPAARARDHLAALADAFDDTAPHAAGSPHFFASDLTTDARPVVIDGSQELIDTGLHREAVFWMVATFAKCQRVLDDAAPAPVRAWHERALWAVLADLGIESVADLHRRARRLEASLPAISTVADELVSGNPPAQDRPNRRS